MQCFDKEEAMSDKTKSYESMTDRERSDMWKEAIEKSLTEVQELRERLHPVAFTSPLWGEYRGAYDDALEQVAFLFCPKELVPDMNKIIRLDIAEKDDYRINFDNLCENLSHQLSFYNATYLALPYLVLLLEKKRQAQDFEWQLLIIRETGIILSTDLPYEWKDRGEKLPREVLDSYQLSREILRDMTKEFLRQHLDRIKMESQESLQYFITALLAIFGDPGAAFQLAIGAWEQTPIECPECDYYDEDMEDGFYNEDLIKEKIKPAESVIGKWDGQSFEDTYLWFSNLAHELGIEDEWKIPYYYGTYTCPQCGKKGVLMEWMKDIALK